jgi:FtsZ-interacting cell division protein ZipA
LSESSSSGRGADDNDEEITGTGEENIEGIDEEEENPLPVTQEQEEDSEAGQQSHQQSEEEEQQEEDEIEEPQEEVQDAAMAKECNMTPRLQFWYGNNKDRTSIEWCCDAVDRIKDQKGWNNDQGKKSAASVAVEALREDALLLMSIIAKGHQAAAVKDWSLMKPLLIKRY